MKKILSTVLLVMAFCTTGMAQQTYTMVKDVPYVPVTDTSTYRKERCKLDILYPEGKTKFKTLVWFHGGGLEGGHKEIPAQLRRQGFAVVAPNYRLYPRCKNPQYTEDAAAAVAWVVKNIARFGGDPSQVYVSGHSAGGYLTLMLALDKNYLAKEDIDADSIKGYFPVSGQTATHFTIRKERHIPFGIPVVDKYAPLNNARKLATKMVLFTGDRSLEMTARYEENLYLKAILESLGNKEITIHELSGFNHGTVVAPACLLIDELMK